jgi:DNA-binding NarL/FixJ family response regulator
VTHSRLESREGGAVTVVAGVLEPLMSRGLASVLGEDRGIHLLDHDLEGDGFSQIVMELAPDVAIVGEKHLRALSTSVHAIKQATRIVVLAREPRHSFGMVLLTAGVACVAGNASVTDILATVHIAARGGCVFVSSDRRRIERPDHEQPTLTKRECQVLERLSEDVSYEEIARDLEISVATIKKYTSGLLRKLGASSKRELRGVPVFHHEPSTCRPSQSGSGHPRAACAPHPYSMIVGSESPVAV